MTEKNSKLIGLDCGSKYHREQVKFELEKSKKTYNTVNLSKLPDKGIKLKNKIDELESLLRNLNLEQHTVEDKCGEKNVKSDNLLSTVHTELKNDLSKNSQNNDITSCIISSRTFDHLKSEKCKSSSKIDSVPFMNVQPLPLFSDLAADVSKKTYENNESPSFRNWREPKGKIQFTEAKPLITSGATKCLNFGTKPLIDVNDESVKNLRISLVTYPDDSLEEDDPENLKSVLMTHQKKALAWLIWRERQDPCGGVLADDMGLGKTITIISLILKQKENHNYFKSELEDKECKATLIVCSASIIHQWNSEIIKHCSQDALEVLVYHGPKRDRNFKNMGRYDVVLTTYNILMCEKKAYDNSKVESPLFKLKWERIVLDEAHAIKNHSSLTAQAIFCLKGFRRWAVTGTPIHNVFKDMYSLVKFLQFSPFDDYKKFKKFTDDSSESSDKRKKLLVKSIVLRRTKDEMDEHNKPLIEMKSKTFSIIYIELSGKEREVYDKLNEKTSKKIDQYLNNSKMKSSALLVLLLRLQQCCSHMHLLKESIEDDDMSSDITKNLSSLTIDANASNSSSSENNLDLTFSEFDAQNVCDISVKSSKIQSLFEELKKISIASENKDKSVIVSQWVSLLDIISFHLKEENIDYYIIAGNTKAEDRQRFADDFNTKNHVKVMLLSLKAGGVGLNLTGANHLFLLDLHWNPALEMQACDRIHRVGQEKDVTIHKFICKDTIEEKILKLQDEKRSIAKSALHGVKQNTKGMTIEDFMSLFNIRK